MLYPHRHGIKDNRYSELLDSMNQEMLRRIGVQGVQKAILDWKYAARESTVHHVQGQLWIGTWVEPLDCCSLELLNSYCIRFGKLGERDSLKHIGRSTLDRLFIETCLMVFDTHGGMFQHGDARFNFIESDPRDYLLPVTDPAMSLALTVVSVGVGFLWRRAQTIKVPYVQDMT